MRPSAAILLLVAVVSALPTNPSPAGLDRRQWCQGGVCSDRYAGPNNSSKREEADKDKRQCQNGICSDKYAGPNNKREEAAENDKRQCQGGVCSDRYAGANNIGPQ